MNNETSGEMIEHIRRRAEQVSGQETTIDDVKNTAIEVLSQRKADEMRTYLSQFPLEHLLHLLAYQPDPDR